MKLKRNIFVIFLAILVLETKSLPSFREFQNEEELEEFLNSIFETEASSMCYKQVVAEWDFATDVNNKAKEEAQTMIKTYDYSLLENSGVRNNYRLVIKNKITTKLLKIERQMKELQATLESAEFSKSYWEKHFRDLNPDDYKKEIIKRQVKDLIILGNAALEPEKLTELTNIGNTMTNTYSTAKICPFTNQNCNLETEGLSLEPGIESIMSTSENYKELEYAWTKWREVSGAQIKKHYDKYIELSNEAAKANGFEDQGKMWISHYESPTFIEDMDRLWQQVKPLYNELHRYVRNKLKERYKDEIDVSDGLIPAHLLGNMWAQSWVNLYSLVVPFPDASSMDVTAALKEQNYTVLKMFEIADEFYKSLGLLPNDICYNVAKGAMIEKPADREVLCHASAWDFCDKENYRVKMCTEVNYEDFITIHHEMGHIQYYLQYKDQPITLRTGANPGFHEAVGDTIALSVATPKHLIEIGLLKDYEDTAESSINALMNMALERVAFLPFGLLIDKWRWDVFAGKVAPEKWNSHWWHYRNFIQKVKAPVPRSDDTDFDPGAKYHVAGGSQYINYFVAHILEFQLYRGLCEAAGQYDPKDPNKPLHKCDFYKSVDAGNKLKAGLSLGASKHWKDALEQMTGEKDLDASAILDYFKPLYYYLKKENGRLSEDELNNFLKDEYEPVASSISNQQVVASWNFATDIDNKTKEEAKVEATLKSAEFAKLYWTEYFRDLQESDYKEESLKRQVKSLKILGNSALGTEKLTQLTNVGNTMSNIYSTGKICPYSNQNCDIKTEGLSLEPDLENIMASSTNYDELLYIWEKWRKASGAEIKQYYPTYVSLSNEAAEANGFKDKGEMWRNDYESETFIEDIDKLWEQVKPLYEQLHKYVAKKLKERYGDKINIEDGLIPAHVLGNMWAQSWLNLSPLVKPYPDASSIDVTAALKEQNYTVLKMFLTSDEFYKSLDLEPNDMSYDVNRGAVIEKPEDREILCHASAWDFSDKKDFRIKMCTEVNYEDFITVHHEMGHIQYFIQYKDQPISFRTGANPGFHEAVGDTIALSVATPAHLEKIGLLKDYVDSDESAVNTLMDMALQRVAFLPFGLLIDKWRWDVFAGNVSSDRWNSHWWKYRETIQKIKAPVERSDLNDFDPGSKYHVPAGSQYINYFVAHILEFQLYRGLCIASGQYDPNDKKVSLHKCDFYQSKEAGEKLSAGLSLGARKHWRDALEVMTGERDLDATAMLEYFAPLLEYLKEQNRMNEEELTNFLKDYESTASEVLNKQVVAEWNYATDVDNKDKEKEQLEATLKTAEFDKSNWDEHFRYLKEEDYKDEALQRQVKVLKVLGNAALDTDKLTELTNTGSYMTNIYSTAKICPYDKQNCILENEGLSLEPDLANIMAKSTNYDELSYIWEAWRKASGANIKEKYSTYVSLSNEAAVANGYKDKGVMWREDYQSPTFIEDMNKLWQQVQPLYDQLHRYVGKKLKERYGDKIDITDGLIPAHVLGNMWAQSWINLSPLVKPYPDASSIDVTTALKEQNYTVLKMFKTSDEFYQSLGLAPNDMSYDVDHGAVIEKPDDREILCHASAWDFSDKKDFRIKMCTVVDYEDFITIHHEMGHIQYFIQYKDQPVSFRDGANPGFHEAIGDTIALSVATPKHLEKIGLLKDYEDSDEAAINTLMDMALERVAFLPFGLLIDKWRWDVFAGEVTPEKWNSHWWEYRESIQKVKAPVDRSDATDFDPGAKYHVPGDSQYINYFVAHILEFQLYRGLCKAAGQYDPENKQVPLHKCDFYQSKEAGKRLSDGLSLGSSKQWKDALEAMTGERDLDATAILEYFDPLLQFLKEQNRMNEEELTNFLKDYESTASEVLNKQVVAEWNYATDVDNKDKEKEQLEATLKTAEFDKSNWDEHFRYLKEEDYKDEALQRQVKVLKVLGNAALDTDKLTELTNTGSYMTNIYSTAKICPYDKQNCILENEGLSLEPDLANIMAKSTNYDELSYIWEAWRKASGANIKEKYSTYVSLSNEAAVANGYKDKGVMWREDYESPTFIEDMDKLWQQVQPLYDQLHRYVGKKLKERYSDKIDITDGLIPAHVLGNMWAQSWINLSPLVKPYPDASSIDVTTALKEQNYTVLKMFKTSDEFYQSLGLAPNDMSYDVDRGAVIEKPDDREILCHASAWDFSDKKDFRIKMCTVVDYEDFITIHHEMGHIQYFIQYKDQPVSFRDGANPGFHEAIGDTIALSVATPKHLEKIGLLKDYEDSDEAAINTLMDMALERVAFLPFGLLIDKWRWDVFAGEVTPEKWNSHWWEYRESIQKVKAPVDRSDATDFDPGAKYHVPGDSQYINYFVAHILEFQLYRGLCKAAGQYDPENKQVPLHKCDFYQSKEAGKRLSDGLSLGSSKHWKDALEAMTGERDLDATAILEYFDPLLQFLKEQNRMNEEELTNFLKDYESTASEVLNKQVIAEWNYATDVDNKDKEKEQLEATLKTAEFDKSNWDEHFRYLKEEDYKDEALQRQVKVLKVLGNAALDTDKLTELTNTGSYMTNIYSTAKICPYDNQKCDEEEAGLELEPKIQEILATSTNYDELVYVWKAWRDATGAKMKEQYKTYVELSNEAAQANDFLDKGDMWRSDYESPTFIEDMDRLWEKVKPLYNELHRYVIKKLKARYDELDATDGLIPAHVLGNMWAQSWVNLASLVKPYPDESPVDVTEALQGYTILEMFEIADEFYTSLGLESNSMSYDVNRAVIEKPEDRNILCHASAWDFSDKKDFRIKMCTEKNYEDFITIHHEMGHIQYFIQYKDQPITFRDGANPGFHEAIGDTIALSVATPQHLEKIGLLEDYKDSDKAAINSLMDMALERVAFLPFGLLIDKWRWDVFAGFRPEEWNKQWWHYRETIQKVRAPVSRSDSNDFDPGAKYHVPGDSQYINYFVAHILEFQLYRALCKASGQYDPENSKVPLHKCDYYKSEKAGEMLRAGLKLGSSKHWKDVLREMTGETDLDANAILEYFDPLFKYLKEENGPLVDEREFKNFLSIDYEPSASKTQTDQVTAEWNYVTDVSNTSKKEEQLAATLRSAEFTKFYYTNYFENLNEAGYNEEEVQRQVRFLQRIGNAALDTDKLEQLTNVGLEMTNIYSTARICPYNNPNCDTEKEGLTLDPDIEQIMATSTNYKELEYAWKAWRDASGAKIKDLYPTYVKLSNEAAEKNGFEDKGEMWRSEYESETFVDDVDKLWEEVKPLYDELHQYVAKKLKERYGDEINVEDGFIPAHVLGNMWGQSWSNLFSLVKPFPDASEMNITAALLEQDYTVLKMFTTSDDFYKSLGLEPNDMSYNEKLGAVIVKPTDRDIVCHASAWDFSNGKDFRIKMCTNVNYKDFITVHHEMGHIQYFILYKDQPIAFRTGANPGFHEAVGDTIVLSVATPQHLQKIGLLKDYEESDEAAINTLMDIALERVAFLPFGLLIDKWRWDVFNGSVPQDEWNKHWWHYRETLQKVRAPVGRSDEDDFDPGAKYHVPGDSQYINYFVARILQFQLYRGLCIAAGEYDPENKDVPLHKCDFYKSTAAGDKLRNGLQLGASKHWKDALEAITGEREISASALIEYFQPLMEYLRAQNNPSGSKDDDDSNQTVPIVVGSVLGVALVGGIGFYGYKRYQQR